MSFRVSLGLPTACPRVPADGANALHKHPTTTTTTVIHHQSMLFVAPSSIECTVSGVVEGEGEDLVYLQLADSKWGGRERGYDTLAIDSDGGGEAPVEVDQDARRPESVGAGRKGAVASERHELGGVRE